MQLASAETPPDRPWVMRQTWSKLLFAHWPLNPDVLRPLIPRGLTLDTFDGAAWVAVVPFYMSGIRLRMLPPIPTTTEFCELNVRTYVRPPNGKAGVWFLSLDASSPLAVIGARAAFHLPYYNADMRLQPTADHIHYISRRTHRGIPPAAFEATYHPTGAVYPSQPSSLEHWLTERYSLYAADHHGHLYQSDIAHDPWPLQPADAEITRNTMAQAAGISLPDTRPLLHYAHSIDVRAWYLHRLPVP